MCVRCGGLIHFIYLIYYITPLTKLEEPMFIKVVFFFPTSSLPVATLFDGV